LVGRDDLLVVRGCAAAQPYHSNQKYVARTFASRIQSKCENKQAAKFADNNLMIGAERMSNPSLTKPKREVFRFNISLAITGDGLDFDEISRTLGLVPTHISEKGKRYGHARTLCDFDMWDYMSSIDSKRPLEEHIMTLWDALHPHIVYLRKLKKKFKVSITVFVKSSVPWFEVDYRCLGLFAELEIPFQVSVCVA
jgi:Domain of unknown function (DUF4279)